MSKLDELIKKHCPDGVKYIPIKKCVNSVEKIRWSDSDMESYQYIDLSSVNRDTHLISDITTIDKDNAPSRAQQIVQEGDIIFGTTRPMLKRYCMIDVNYDGQICSTGFCVLRADDNIILNSWLYHNITSSSFFDHVEKLQKGASYPAISDANVKSFKIPVPPLPVQEEIVRILDSFTSLTAELQDKLNTELQARKKQYEYYRHKLLTNIQNAQIVELRNVVKKSTAGGTPKKGMPEFYDHATIPWIRTQDVHFNEITKVNSYITEIAVQKTSAKWIPENCVIVAISGASAGRCAINKIKATTNQHCLNLEIDSTKAIYKYIYYCIYDQFNELISLKQGARGDLNSSLILGIKIPVPSLKEQKRIINILDRFDRLCNDITTGIPAEIAARQKQYEYYRDKLLTFKELS